MVLKPKDKHGFLRLVPRRSHRLGSGKGRSDDLAVLVLVLPHRPLPQGFGILFRQPAKCLFQFGCEQSTIKTHAFQDGLAKFQHWGQVLFDGKMHSVLQFVSQRTSTNLKMRMGVLAYLCSGMKKLHNLEDRRVLKARMEADSRPRTTLSFYRYVHLADPQKTRSELYEAWTELEVLGRTYVAKEGINAQISIPTERFEAFKDHIESLGWLSNLRLNVAVEQGKSFFKLIVRVREKIVADGLEDGTFDVTDCGKHLKASEFNELTDKEDTVLIDMRNAYESEVGHFEGAVCPDVNTFREEIDYVEDMLQAQRDANIVMYCTGGIRCEKASAYLKHKGFKNVHQLEGGIIEYTRQAKEEGLRNKFIGKNFVFDERMAERITDDVIAKCHTCGTACDTHVNCANPTCNILMIQCDACKTSTEGTCGEACHAFIQLPEEEQRERRKGAKARGGFMTGGKGLPREEGPTTRSRQ
jgi:UPF0176 protein